MVRKRPVIVWDPNARTAFKQAIAYIKKDSLQNAERLRLEINAAVRKLADVPECLHSPDKYKRLNDGCHRAFEIHRYRIAYFVGEGTIRIVRFRHTSQNSETY